jgi:hypothetical protein
VERTLRTFISWVLIGAVVVFCGLVNVPGAAAQDNYEIQVYGYDQVPAKHTMVEVHSNFTVNGTKNSGNGLLPTHHALHETLEITHGFTEWFETGFYIFTSARSGNGIDFVGTHIRPRVRAPEKWRWPVGVSFSNEIGYQRRAFSADTWTWEMRPIVDQRLGKLYLAFNPALERSIHGENSARGFEFSPNFKAGYDFTKKISGGIEYYGAMGPVSGFDPLQEQQHQIFAVADLNVAPKWEINFGLGAGLTPATDHFIAKMILGYRFDF